MKGTRIGVEIYANTSNFNSLCSISRKLVYVTLVFKQILHFYYLVLSIVQFVNYQGYRITRLTPLKNVSQRTKNKRGYLINLWNQTTHLRTSLEKLCSRESKPDDLWKCAGGRRTAVRTVLNYQVKTCAMKATDSRVVYQDEHCL